MAITVQWTLRLCLMKSLLLLVNSDLRRQPPAGFPHFWLSDNHRSVGLCTPILTQWKRGDEHRMGHKKGGHWDVPRNRDRYDMIWLNCIWWHLTKNNKGFNGNPEKCGWMRFDRQNWWLCQTMMGIQWRYNWMYICTYIDRVCTYMYINVI